MIGVLTTGPRRLVKRHHGLVRSMSLRGRRLGAAVSEDLRGGEVLGFLELLKSFYTTKAQGCSMAHRLVGHSLASTMLASKVEDHEVSETQMRARILAEVSTG